MEAADARMDRADARMDRADARMDRFEKQLHATAKLVRAGVKIVSRNGQDIAELKASFREMNKKMDRVIDLLLARSNNGRYRR